MSKITSSKTSNSVGNKIKEIRKARGFSQQILADKLSIDRAQYSRVETGASKPTLTTLEKIAEALEVDLVEFFQKNEAYDINSYDKGLVEKVKLINLLDEEVRKSIFSLVDVALANKRYQDFFKKETVS